MEDLIQYANEGNIEEMKKLKDLLFAEKDFTSSFKMIYSAGVNYGHLEVLELVKEWYSEWLTISKKLLIDWDKDIEFAEKKGYDHIIWFLKKWKWQTNFRNFFWDIWFITEKEKKERDRKRAERGYSFFGDVNDNYEWMSRYKVR